MTEYGKPMLPLRVGALLTVNPTLRVRVSARADALQIQAPFGDLTVPYALITRVARVPGDGIALHLVGATLQLDLPKVPDMAVNYLLDLVEQGGARGPVANPGKTQHRHPR